MTSVALRVQKHRSNLRALGFRPIQIWVPDTRRKGFKEECRRQSRLVQSDQHEKKILKEIEITFDDGGWV